MFQFEKNIFFRSLFLSIIVAGCASGAGDDDGAIGANSASAVDDSAVAADSASAAAEAITAVMRSSLSRRGSRVSPDALERTITEECPEGGSATLNGSAERPEGGTGTDKSVTFQGTVELSGCNGWTGALGFDGNASGSKARFEFNALVSGSLSGSCTVQVESLAIDGTKDSAAGTTLAKTANVSGSLSATCSGKTTRCVWENVVLADKEALEAGCNLL